MTSEREPDTLLPPDPDRHLAALFDGMPRFLPVVGCHGARLLVRRKVKPR